MKPLEILCKKLGVEVNKNWEAFGLNNELEIFTVFNNTLWKWYDNGDEDSGEWIEASMREYTALVKGDLKPNWKPRQEEVIYVIDLGKENGVSTEKWANLESQRTMLKNNALFRTKQEAEQVAKKVLDIIIY